MKKPYITDENDEIVCCDACGKPIICEFNVVGELVYHLECYEE